MQGKTSGSAWAVSRSTLLAVALLAHSAGITAAADGGWLDAGGPANWNVVGADVPIAAPSELPIDPRFEARERPAETVEDQQVVQAGWRLFGAYRGGWGVTVLQATSGYDGMGRPWGYQAFVFVDGRFAGTLAPEPMNSREDGALDDLVLQDGEHLAAEFRRYADRDPLCCPSGAARVQYRIERGTDDPLLVPVAIAARAISQQ